MGALRWLELDSLTNIVSIVAATEVGSYTCNADRLVFADLYAQQVVGSGDYVYYATKTPSGLSEGIVGPKTTQTLAAGETVLCGQTIGVTLRNGDVMKVYLKGLAGDNVSAVDTRVNFYEDAAPLDTDLAALMADVGDASASAKGSLYGILGNPATQALSTQMGYASSGNSKADATIIKAAAIDAAIYAVLNGGISFKAEVTSKVGCGANDFIALTLVDVVGAGAFADATAPYRCFVLHDAGGAGAAPQGETQTVTAFVNATGKVTTNAFSTPIEVGDIIILMHPRIAELADIHMDVDNIHTDVSAVPDLVWVSTTHGRTLTQSAAEVAETMNPGTLAIKRGDSWSQAITGLGVITGYTYLDFTVKRSEDDDDEDAIIRIRKASSGIGDGLLVLNGETGTAADGSITINDAALGNITIALAATATDDLELDKALYYDIQKITGAAVLTMGEGILNVNADITRAVT